MHPYTAADTLRIAKRYNNPKRSYLLVNPLQAKQDVYKRQVYDLWA